MPHLRDKKHIFRKVKIEGTLTLLSGLHIGDSKESVEIGGVDSPVVRRKDNNQPYIPGSSLKGKMRCLLEQVTGKFDKFRTLSDEGQIISELFGSQGDDGLASSLIVRDAYLTKAWEEKLRKSPHTDMPYTEVKFENTIDRFKGTADNPRQIERVPAGAEFEVNFVINVWAGDDKEAVAQEKKLLETFKQALTLLQDDYLGGSGSRGYGQVAISLHNTKSDTYSDLLSKIEKNTIS